ncbi:choice-of-anchor tandem repeat GloVer-containing protein [Prosthecobacter sp.]|uniref:choice-of-anchor tandem repeat GloVer-containing protein n=1 Tax=Prosthecobacter sp. TaxID=1965333 RepID=UPI0037840A42
MAPAGQIGPAWIPIGPAATIGGQVTVPPNNEIGGAVQSVAIHPTNPDIMYVATVNGGVWKTTNGTATSPSWTPLMDTVQSLNMGALEFDPTDATYQTLVASSARESSLGGQGGGRIGVLRTTDGGATWSVLSTSLFVNENLSSVAARGTVILTASDTDYTSGFFPANGSGLFRSTSTGASFTLVSGTNGLPAGPISDLIGDPSNPSRFFAVVRTVGVFRSDDTGATWTNVTGNITGFSTSVVKSEMALFNNGTNSALYIALLGSSAPLSLWRSTTLGTTWTQMDTPSTGGQTNVHFSIATDRNDPKYVYVGGQSGRYRGDATAAAGSQLTSLHSPNSSSTTPHADSREMFCSPDGTLVETSDGGIYRRPNPTNNTSAWNSANGNLACFEAHNVAYDAVNHIAMLGAQDNGCHIQLSSTNTVWQWISGGDGGAVAIDDTSTANTSIRYGSSQNLGGFYRKTYNASNVLQSTVSPALTVLNGGPAISGSFSTPIQLNKVDATRLIIGASNAAYESLNRGDTVTALSPTSSVNGSSSTGGPVAYGGWLNGTPNPDILYYGSGSTVKIRTTSGGAVSSTAAAFPGGTVQDIVLDRNDYRHVFVAGTSSVYHSPDSGATWINITGDLTGVGVTRTLEFFKLYGTDCVAVGTDLGLYVSFVNNLGVWQKLGTGFPNAICFDMTYSVADSVLVVGTLGRSVWKLPIQTTPLNYLTISLTSNTATEGDAPLTAMVTAVPTPTSDLTVSLTSNDISEVQVPATVTILANQSSASFAATVLDDALLDGTQTATLSASATGYFGGTNTLTVQDNETATLTVSMPASATEGSGTVQGTVTMSAPADSQVTVSLASNDSTAATVPATMTIAAGQTSGTFTITIVDDNKIDGTQNATISASVANWTTGSASIAVLDNETTTLSVSLPATVLEGGTGTGTVSIPGTLTTGLTVSLSSNITSRLTVPSAVTIAAGSTSATFTATGVNNSLLDGSATVTVTATASGFTSGSGTTTVLDNDVHHYVWNTVGSPQGRGVPFTATITAQSIDNLNISSYTGTAALTANGTSGADLISPTTTTAFVAGTWTGSITVNSFDTNVVLTANDGSGHTGSSNAFNVSTGPLHHFSWNTQSARGVNTPASATITAQDAGNNTVTSFAGTVALSGLAANPAGSSVVISEVNTNTPDEIEFTNVGLTPVSIGGWTIVYWDYDTAATASKSFTIPAGTTLGAGQIFRLTEFGTSPGTFPQFYTGANINWTSGTTDNVGVMLRDASGGITDFMCAAGLTASSITSPVTIPTTQWSGAPVAAPSDPSFSYVRTGSSDLNTSANWTTAAPGIGTLNSGLTIPFPSSTLAVQVNPTVSGSFSSGVWTGNLTVNQIASQMKLRADDGSSHTGDSSSFDVTGTLSLSVPSSAPENNPPVTGTVTVSSPPAGNLVVALTSSDITAATVPATVTILAGQTSATFSITLVDDLNIDGTQVATITAHLSNWTDATANINVLDNETLALALFLPGAVTEGSTATGTVSASGAVANDLVVSLASNTTSRLTVPATATILAGSSSATFTVTGVDNALTDGSAPVNVTASANGYTGANANTTVLDNDVHHYGFASIPSPQTKGVGFSVSITAYELGNNVIATYNGTPTLTATGTGGANAISPGNASGFINGVWTGQVTAFITDTNVTLSVSDGLGHSGSSNAFDIINPVNVLTVVEPLTPVSLSVGQNPRAQLITGADSNFYGTTVSGGNSNQGSVYKMTTSGVITTLVNFYGANGMQPNAGLILGSDGNYYGTTTSGGVNNLGTVFKMTPGGVLTTLVHLTTTSGTAPRAPLLQAADGNFYGTTSGGGSSSFGTIFKMTPSGVLSVLVNFTGTTSTAYGSSCQAGLIQGVDGNLYGVTSTGGSGGGNGTVFKVTTSGTFTSLASFTGTTGTVIGATPLAALVQGSDGNLYGTTSAGGSGTSLGSVFKITTAGVFTSLFSFTGTTGSFLGSSPQAALVQASDGTLWGSTSGGGTNSVGTLFKTTTSGTFTSIRSLVSSSDGSTPIGALKLHSDGNFYGICNSGSTQSRGSVFSYNPTSSTFTRLYSFVVSPAYFKNLIQASDGNFYGGTANGNAGFNSVFKLTPAGVLTTLASFTSNSFAAPYLLQGADGNLYGAVPTEGTYGQLFKLTTSGSKTTLVSFTNTSGSFPGSAPITGLMQDTDGTLFGTTSSGGTGGGFGTAYKVTTGGTFTSLASFTNTSGAAVGNSPPSRLVKGTDGAYYGTTTNGGTGGLGTIYKISAAGVFTNVVQFTGTTGSFPGTNPNTTLLLAGDGNFYGTTTSGGTGGFGTLFKLTADGTGVFTSLVSFTNTSGSFLGNAPSTNLVQGSDGNIYGTTTGGGSGGGFGTVFKITPGGVFTALTSFTGTTGTVPGTSPHGTLRQGADGFFYGTTSSGGLYGIGTVFRVSSTGSFQSLYAFGSNNDGGSPNINGSNLYPDAYRLVAGSDGYLYGVNGSSVFRVHQQPAAQTISVTGLTPTGATLSASVIPNQDLATASFQYGLNTNYGSQTASQNLGVGTAFTPVTAALTGLLPGVVYHYRLATVTPQGTFYSADQTFATTGAPQVITGSFPNAAQTGFSLDGVVNPLGTATTYYFEYGEDTSYGEQTTVQNAGSGIAALPVSVTVNDLLPGTTYHVRLVAANSFGISYGDDQIIKTPDAFTTTLGDEEMEEFEEGNINWDEWATGAAAAATFGTNTLQTISQYLSTGTTPLAPLFKGSDGYFYGTTATGGTFGTGGAIFRVSQGGTMTTLANLYGTANNSFTGYNPQATLVSAPDGNFYGTTVDGGTSSNYGCVFRMTPAGDVSVMVTFNNTGYPYGSDPVASLTVGPDGALYGVTQNGGTGSSGTIFKITTGGTFTTLVSFTGSTGSYLGSSPRAALTLGVDGNFYGTTASGGSGGSGTIFKMTPAGVLTTLVQFTGTSGTYPGSTPLAALVQGTDGVLYGTTSLGGANNLGTVFKVTTTATFTSLTAFSGTTGSVLGSLPKGALVQLSDSNLYGTTQTGGLNNFGTIFQITPAGVLNTLVNLTGATGSALGATPQGALVTGTDGSMYGTTNTGGLNNAGTIFKCSSAGLFTTLVNFTAAPSVGRLIQGGGAQLYGATLGAGGANGYGTLFSAPTAGAPQTLATLAPVSGTTALNARAGLVLGADGNYYGTTQTGGLLNNGSVFKLTPAGVYTTLISFTGTSGANPGSSPLAALVAGSDGNFYGTNASGGTSSAGNVFMMTPAGTQTILATFTGTTGATLGSSPQGPLIQGSDNTYYGTTTSGGSGGGFGTVFKVTSGGVFSNLVNFTGTTGAVLGTSPTGVLAQGADGAYYGVTSSGGLSNLGTVFKMTAAGVFTNLASFTGTTGSLLGSSPTGGLFAGPDGCLYGVTIGGGTYNLGTLFRVTPDGVVSYIYSFTGRNDGITPNLGLLLASDGFLYGGNSTGIYKVNPPPVVLALPATDVTDTTATINGSITGNNYVGFVHFQYGATSAYGFITEDEPFDASTTPDTPSAALTGLQPLQTYHYRFSAVTPFGNFDSPDQTFTTSSTATFNTASDVPVVATGYDATGMQLNVVLGFAPTPGTILKLVDNNGFIPVNGTFNNLPGGATVTASFGAQNYTFVISYSGGDGNDITLTLVTQSINFPALPNKLTTDVPYTLNATATSGLPVSYAITSGAASASISGNTVTLTGTPGAVSVTATQAGDGGTYGPALAVTRTFIVVSGSPFVQLSSSKLNYATLGIKADGTLWGWGYNGYGQLGNGTTNTSYAPTQVGTATNWKYISVGGYHVLAVKTDGTLWAWGANTYGAIGDGTNTQRNSPVQVGALTTWAAVAAGVYHTVALKTDGTLWACGYNADGELGQGTSDSLTTHTSLVQVGSVATWSSVVSGNYHLLATRTDGTLWAWGYNVNGQLGTGSTTNGVAPVQIGTATNWTSLSGGYYHSLGVRSDGTLWAWGRNVEGQIGDATLVQRQSPLQVGTATNWKSVIAGGYYSTAIKQDNSLWTWGQNLYGQLGQGFADVTPRPNVPAQVGTANNWALLAPGFDHTVATRSDGTTWSWGNDSVNELGYSTNNRLLLPFAAQFGAVSSASSGFYHSVVLKSDGTLWTAGGNSNGQLGIGTNDSAEHQVMVQPQPGTQWISAAAGGYHSAAVRSDGTLWTWGYNNYGQVGDGTTTTRTSAVQVGTNTNWASVSCGNYFTVALRTDGTLWAWGYNSDGQMGNGTTGSAGQFSPVQVGSASDWNAVVCGGYHVLAIKQGGSLWGWGYNGYGQIGVGNTSVQTTPVQVGTATTWRSLSAGMYHSIATRNDGTLWTWGRNIESQIGDGSTTQRTAPVQIGSATTWQSVGCGSYHSYASRSDGSLWSWGYNFYNQLGDGGTTTRNSPTRVGTSTGWGVVYKTLGYHTLASSSDSSLWGCGYTPYGHTGYAWRNQLAPELVLPALSPPQTMSFPSIPNMAVGATLTLGAASSSGLPVSYLISGPGTLNGSRLTVNGPGLITVLAWQPGDSYFQSSDMAAQSFNAPPPVVATLAATTVGTTSATLNGSINPNGFTTTAKFQSGVSTSYGVDTVVSLSPSNGTTPQNISTTLTGLIPGTTYHFRASGTNSGGTSTGNDLTFTTLSANLSDLILDTGMLTPAFSTSTTSYSSSVSNSIANTTVTATAADAGATLQIRLNAGAFTALTSGAASNALPLGVGANTIDVRVTASDTVTIKTYTVTVTRRTLLQDWQEANGAANLSGDDDGDGIPNLAEYAFNLDPHGTNRLPYSNSMAINPGDGQKYLMFVYPRRIAASDLTYTVQTSPDLSAGSWGTPPGDITEVGATPNGDGVTETVTVRIGPAASSTTTRRYVRLRITSP